MQLRSVEIAKKFGVVFEVRSSLNDNPGTIVKEETRSMEEVVVRGVALDKNQAKVTLVGVPDRPGVAAQVFKALADAAINVDMIVQNVSHGSDTPRPTSRSPWTSRTSRKARGGDRRLKADVGFQEVAIDEQHRQAVDRRRRHADPLRRRREDVRDARAAKGSTSR